MESVTAIVADDELHLRTGLGELLRDLWPELEIIGLAENGTQALEMIMERRPDIAFLDIRMPGMSGLAVARQLAGLCQVVLVTAYDHYAVEAFEAEALDYVLKPADRTRLAVTVNRLKKRFSQAAVPGTDQEQLKRVVQILENRSAPDYLRLIRVKSGSEIRFLPVTEIFFFKAEDKYTVVRTADREDLIKTPIKTLVARLDPDIFWQVHRSALVNIDRIRAVGPSLTRRMVIRFDCVDATVPVSRSREHLFKTL